MLAHWFAKFVNLVLGQLVKNEMLLRVVMEYCLCLWQWGNEQFPATTLSLATHAGEEGDVALQ